MVELPSAIRKGVLINVLMVALMIWVLFRWQDQNQDGPERRKIEVIWFSGMSSNKSQDKSWVSSLPKLFAKRYPNAKLFIITQQRLPKNAPAHEILEIQNRPLEIVQLKKTAKEFEFIRQPSETLRQFKPDVHFLRNTYKMEERILDQAPWLLAPQVVRVIYPIHNFNNLQFGDVIISSESFLKPLPEWQRDIFERSIAKQTRSSSNSLSTSGKQNFIFFPASIGKLKGQLNVARLLDQSLAAKYNISIVFAGKIYDNEYWEETQRVLTSKKIQFTYLGFVKSRKKISDLYVRARALLHYPPTLAPGPRVVYEGLYGNTPFIVSDQVQIDWRIRSLGVVVQTTGNEAGNFNSQLERLWIESWGDRPLSFARRSLTEATFDTLFEQIECLFANKLNPVF